MKENVVVKVPTHILNQIANSIDAGEKCFLHKKSLEIICWPDDYRSEHEIETDEAFAPLKEDMKKVKADPSSYLEIEKMNSSESFKVMDEFISSLPNTQIKARLINAINGKKPFANFKFQIDNTFEERELWFAFRRRKNIEWVERQLRVH